MNPRAGHRFYSGMAIVLGAIILVGFAPTFFLRGLLPLPPGEGELFLWPMVHGVVNTAWVLLFIVQTQLVARGNTALHKRLGMLGLVLFIVVVVIALVNAIDDLRRYADSLGDDPRPFFLGQTLPAIVLYAVLVITALLYRHRPQIHKRLMLLAAFQLIFPGFDRIFYFYFPGPVQEFIEHYLLTLDSLVLIAVGYELWSRRRVHPALLWGGGAMVLQPVLHWVAEQPAITDLADYFL